MAFFLNYVKVITTCAPSYIHCYSLSPVRALGAFERRFSRTSVSFIMFVCVRLCVRTEQLGAQRANFCDILYCGSLLKSVENIKV
jgi:hypothetical protein